MAAQAKDQRQGPAAAAVARTSSGSTYAPQSQRSSGVRQARRNTCGGEGRGRGCRRWAWAPRPPAAGGGWRDDTMMRPKHKGALRLSTALCVWLTAVQEEGRTKHGTPCPPDSVSQPRPTACRGRSTAGAFGAWRSQVGRQPPPSVLSFSLPPAFTGFLFRAFPLPPPLPAWAGSPLRPAALGSGRTAAALPQPT